MNAATSKAVAEEHARRLLRPADHRWTRQELETISPDEYEANRPAIHRALEEDRVT